MPTTQDELFGVPEPSPVQAPVGVPQGSIGRSEFVHDANPNPAAQESLQTSASAARLALPQGLFQAPAANPPVRAPAGSTQGTDLFSTDDQTSTLNTFAGNAPEVQPNETVQGQLEGILDKDNALFDWARGQASQYANSRGLQNSDIAAQASSQAVLETALPIAQQDANTFAQRAQQEAGFWQAGGLQAMQGTIQSALMAQDHMNSLVEMAQQGDINSRLQLEQFGYNFDLSVQDNLNQMAQLAMQGDINAELALQAFGFDTELMEQDFGYRVSLTNLELANALELSSQDHSQWLERIASTHTNTLSEIEAQALNRIAEIQESGAQDLIVQTARIEQELESTLAAISASGDEDMALQIRAAEDAAARDLANIEAQDANLTRQQVEEFSRNLQANYLLATEHRSLQFSAEVAAIYQQEGLNGRQQEHAVTVARQNMENDINMLSEFYSSSPFWDPNWTPTQVNSGAVQQPEPNLPPPYIQPGDTPNLPSNQDLPPRIQDEYF